MPVAALSYGSNNTTVQVCGDHNTISICQRPAVTLWRPPDPRTRKPAHELQVLQSHFESIPFTARQSELSLVANWLATPEPISVLAFVGPGGSGKTRLALELFKQHAATWTTGFITAFHPPNALAKIATQNQPSTKQPLLAVVDYAASHTAPLRAFLEDLAQYGSVLPKLRLMVLERFADPQSGWYQRLFNYSQTQYTAGLFYQPEPITLTPVSTTADRRAIFQHALHASAEFHPNTPRPPEAAIDNTLLAKPAFADPLVVMMAALASWDKGIYGALNLSRPDLAVAMARRERTRLTKRSDSKLLPHLAAHSTLCGGFDHATLLIVAREESTVLGLTHKDGPGQLAADLAELLPGPTPGTSGPVLPDIIGEAFVLDVKPEGISRAAHRDGPAVVRTLTRALQDFYDPHKVRGENRSGIDGSQAVTWIRGLAAEADAGDVDLLFAISSGLPESSLELAQLAADLNAKLLTLLSADENLPEPLQAERARLLNNYALRLSAIGQREEALQAAREASDIYRQLAAARPDAFLPDLATSLNNYGTMLSAIGQREEALQAAREASDIYRQLAAARPDAFLPDLATSLNNYGTMLSAIGQREEALQAAREAVEIRRQLAAARPDAFLPDLATSLNNYGTMLSAIGQREEALQAAREASDIYRQLAAARPDAFLPYLASSLNNYGTMLSAIGQREEALQAAREAVEIRRQLAAARPDAFLPDLATSLNNYGTMLSAIGQREEALQAAREAVEIRRQLAAARPDAFLPDLATSLNNYGTMLSAIGQREEALQAAREASDIYRQLAAARPDAFLPYLASSLNNYGTMLSAIGQREEALQAAREAVEIRRQLAAARPDAFLPDLATSLNNYGTMLSAIGQREEALQAAREASDIYRQLAAARPDAFLPDLATSLNNYGNRLSAIGQREEALQAAREASDIYRQLAAARPDAFLPDLATSLNNYGTRLSAIGQREEALQAAREASDIYRQLAAARPDAFLPDLATSLNNYGNRLSDIGQREEALQAAREAVEIRRQLAAARPDAFLPNLAMSLAAHATITADPSESTALFHEALQKLLPQFLKLPHAHARLMAKITSYYFESCQKSGAPLDSDLLMQIVPVFEKLKPETQQQKEEAP